MKRLMVLTTIILLVLAVGASAQNGADEKKISFGITGGLSMGNWSGSDADPGSGVDKKMRTGIAGGMFVDFAVGPSIAFQPQLLYAQKGVKYSAGGVSVDGKFDYVEIPLLFKWVPETQGNMQPTIFAGPYLGFLMSAKVADIDIKEFSKSTDFGITFGAGIGNKMSSGELFFDVRLDLGMSKIDDGTPQANIKNTAFMALVGYKFGG